MYISNKDNRHNKIDKMVVLLNPVLAFKGILDNHIEVVTEVEVVGEFVEGGHHTDY